MPTHFRDPVLTCDNCGATADRPVGANYRTGWERLRAEGWTARANGAERPLRFLPHTTIHACGDCPSVAVDQVVAAG
ncbi:hypothetical protein [Streptomyces sp. NPDC049879]|uniref:hypothetical protein n=1 Tax=Streptomyces sp. NPDC049879 TaxID=3365598 RepID=UPI0037972AD6